MPLPIAIASPLCTTRINPGELVHFTSQVHSAEISAERDAFAAIARDNYARAAASAAATVTERARVDSVLRTIHGILARVSQSESIDAPIDTSGCSGTDVDDVEVRASRPASLDSARLLTLAAEAIVLANNRVPQLESEIAQLRVNEDTASIAFTACFSTVAALRRYGKALTWALVDAGLPAPPLPPADVLLATDAILAVIEGAAAEVSAAHAVACIAPSRTDTVSDEDHDAAAASDKISVTRCHATVRETASTRA